MDGNLDPLGYIYTIHMSKNLLNSSVSMLHNFSDFGLKWTWVPEIMLTSNRNCSIKHIMWHFFNLWDIYFLKRRKNPLVSCDVFGFFMHVTHTSFQYLTMKTIMLGILCFRILCSLMISAYIAEKFTWKIICVKLIPISNFVHFGFLWHYLQNLTGEENKIIKNFFVIVSWI